MSGNALWQQLRKSTVSSVSVVGMTKNSGKTVCLNYLLAQAAADGLRVGLSSIGRDGEANDEVFSFAKPAVAVWPMTLVATARDCLVRAEVKWEMVHPTGMDSPMGEIVIVRVLGRGEMEIAGPSRNVQQIEVARLMRRAGAQLLLLDGALGRSQHATPALADSVVLATGAALGGSMADVLRKTADKLALLGVAQADLFWIEKISAHMDAGKVSVWNSQGDCVFSDAGQTLVAGAKLAALTVDDMACVALPGAVGQQLWQVVTQLAQAHSGLQVVVADGTRLFITPAQIAAFRRSGGTLLAQRGINVLGLTVNPFCPHGINFDALAFEQAAQTYFPDVVVCDLWRAQALSANGGLH